MQNAIRLSMNLEALNALFPEGSEYRLELRNALLRQASEQFIKGQITPSIESFLSGLATQVVHAVDMDTLVFNMVDSIEGRLLAKGLNNSHSSSRLQVLVEKRVQEHISKAMGDRINAIVAERVAAYESTLESRTRNLINAKLTELEKAAVQVRVNEAVSKIMSELGKTA